MHDFDLNPFEAGEAAEPTGPAARFRMGVRVVIASLIILVALIAECIVMVPADQAVVITRLGDPVRVITRPGLAWKLPTPLETTVPIDLRLRTTSTGLQDVGTRDGLRVLAQVYTAWQVPDDPRDIRQFLRALRNQPDEAARQLRSFVGAGHAHYGQQFQPRRTWSTATRHNGPYRRLRGSAVARPGRRPRCCRAMASPGAARWGSSG